MCIRDRNKIEHENIIKEKNWISTFYIFCLIGIGCMIILLFKLLHKSKFIKNHESLDFNSIPKHSIHSNLRYKIKQNIVGDIGTSQEIEAIKPVSYTHLRAHETVLDLVCRLLLEKKKHKQ